MSIQANYAQIKNRISQACNRVNREENVQVIAVTKYVSVETAKEAVDSGVTELGENRVEGFRDKHDAIGDAVNWHFIGTLQSKKVKHIIQDVDYIHSLDRLSLAKEINKRSNKTVPCFVQVNTSGEDSKHGLDPENVESFIKEIKEYEQIKVVGLMTMAPLTEDEQLVRDCFKKLRTLRDQILELNLEHAPCTYLSMGMSNDYEIAVEEGATHIRVGSSLVGNETK